MVAVLDFPLDGLHRHGQSDVMMLKFVQSFEWPCDLLDNTELMQRYICAEISVL